MNEHTTVLEKKRVRPVVAGLTPYSGTFGREQVIHLLKRTMFGAKRADVDFFATKTLAQTLDILMTAAPTPSLLPLRVIVDDARCATDPNYCDTVSIGQTWVDAIENGNINNSRMQSLKAWWVGQMLNQGRSIHEKMVVFWHNHFSTELVDTTAIMGYWMQDLCRRHALGNFKTMTKEVTFEAGMLRYLNGYLNNKTAPDENYGRELQELFTLGKGPNSKYTEDDVKAAARVLTGWIHSVSNTGANIGRQGQVQDTVTGKYKWGTIFNSGRHDTNNKVFSSFYGGVTITSSAATNTEANALREYNEMMDMIFANAEVAMFISRKLYRFFVYYDIDATVETDVIAPMAQLIRANNYNILPALRALLASDHFFEVAQKACFIKGPLDYLVGAAREFDIVFPTITTPAADAQIAYAAWLNIASSAATQGQSIGDPPNVAGWPAYYQEPMFHETWINTDTFPKRLRVTDNLLTTNGINVSALVSGVTVTKKLLIDAVKYTDAFGDTIASDPNLLIDKALELLYRVPPTAAMRTYLKTTVLLGGQASDHYWTDAWVAYKAAPTNAAALNVVTTRLQAFYKFLVQNPEYQLV